MVDPLKLRPKLANESTLRSITHTLLPLSDSMLASCDPTRPQPTTMTLLMRKSFPKFTQQDNAKGGPQAAFALDQLHLRKRFRIPILIGWRAVLAGIRQ